MNRQALLAEVKEYFVASDHWRRICASLQDLDPTGTHIHTYVDTSVHPDSLEAIMCGYFQRMGWPSARKIDHMAPKAGMGSLHGVEPKGKPHFDFQWFYKPDVGLKACEGGESGCNLLIWNRWYINRFNSQFPFKDPGPAEEKAMEAYFKSDHFLKGLDYPVKPTTNHMHVNVHTGVHPDHIQRHAEMALAKLGWKVYYTCPNVYLVQGKYQGKLVFMCQKPEVVWDIGWRFDSQAILEPALETWIFDANPGYDVWTSAMLADVMAHDYVRLTDAEVAEVLAACRLPR
ncbi:MAG: hypothetical protein ACE147_21500 [Candidatus Methylomirabilales bacterium]